MKKTLLTSVACVALLSGSLHAFEPKKPVCLAPAKPGGGFDLTCRLVSNSLGESKLLAKPMMVNFMPGGVGAVAYNHVIGQRPDDGDTIVAASTGSALNIAQGKFGQHDENAVRWVAGLGTDYGAIIVKADAKWKNLGEMLADLKANPKSFAIGSGGSVGSQDWFKSALVAKAGGVDPKEMKYVAFEGGGEGLTALLGGHIQVFSGDISEFSGQAASGKYRVLAVLADKRVDGQFKDIPTAKEQGYDVVWNTWRGYYVGPKVTDEQYNYWVNLLKKVSKTEAFAKEREARGLYEFTKIGKEFDTHVKEEVKRFRVMAKEAGLLK